MADLIPHTWNNVERRMAQLLSIVFQPMFLPLMTVWMLFNSGTYIEFISPPAVRKFVYITLFLNMVILPLLIFAFLFRKKVITTYHIDKREERKYAFVVTLSFFVITYYIFRQVQLPSVFYSILYGGFVSVAIAAIITLVWKISIHMMGVGGLVGSVLGLSILTHTDLTQWLFLSLIISGLTGFARLKLFAHTPSQVYCGFTLGLTVMLSAFILG